MKKKKILIILLCMFVLTGCTKILKDDENKVVKNNLTGQNITETYVDYINFAVAEYYELDEEGEQTETLSSYTCANAPRTGTFTTTQTVDQFNSIVTGWYDSPLITNLTGPGSVIASTRFPILPGTDSSNEDSITYRVYANSTTSHRFKFWAWIDSSYEFTSQGTTVTDPLQDAKITISWSDASIVKQVTETTNDAEPDVVHPEHDPEEAPTE